MSQTSEERAIKAADELLDFVNSYSVDEKTFAKRICQSHKTLQQSVMRLFLTYLREMAANENVDDRNRASVELAKNMARIAEDTVLPFV